MLLRSLAAGLLAMLLAACVREGPENPLSTSQGRAAASAAYVQLGLGYLQEGETARAKVPLVKALELDPRSADAHAAMALVFQSEMEPQLADEHFRKALLAKSDNHTRILNNYGSFLYEQGRYEEAMQRFSKATEDTYYAGRSRVFENMGLTALKLNQPDKAAEYFERTLRLDPKQPQALLELAELARQQRDYGKALSYYQRFTELSSQNARSLLLGIRPFGLQGEKSRTATEKTVSGLARIPAVLIGAAMKTHAPEIFDEPARPGEVLREAREQRGLSIEEVATALNLTVERVRQIEEQQWPLFPGLTFARGYLRQYARLLELDDDALVEQFNQATDGLSVEPLAAQERLGTAAPRKSWLNVRLLSLIVLIVLATLGFFWWEGQGKTAKEVSSTTALDWPLELEGSADASLEGEPLLVPLEEELPPASEINAEVTAEQSPPPVVADESAAQSSAALDHHLALPALPVLSSPPREGVLNFDFSDDCWLQVKDGAGKVLFSGILSASDTLELSGTTPLELRMGNPRAVKLRYNGEPVLVTPTTTRLTLGT